MLNTAIEAPTEDLGVELHDGTMTCHLEHRGRSIWKALAPFLIGVPLSQTCLMVAVLSFMWRDADTSAVFGLICMFISGLTLFVGAYCVVGYRYKKSFTLVCSPGHLQLLDGYDRVECEVALADVEGVVTRKNRFANLDFIEINLGSNKFLRLQVPTKHSALDAQWLADFLLGTVQEKRDQIAQDFAAM
ncbi:MAG: hypothetical protein HN348_24895, partial [Proteobacteria bacterium]|nr:hypothetical protein [Pseudomonadota bacterium]